MEGLANTDIVKFAIEEKLKRENRITNHYLIQD